MLKGLTVWMTTNCGKFLKKREYQSTLSSCETYMQIKKQEFELAFEQQTASKLVKEYVKAAKNIIRFCCWPQGDVHV